MKKILLGCAAVIFSAGIANATDLPARAPNIYKATPASSWSGFYLGAHGGYGWGDFDWQNGNAIGLPVAPVRPAGGFGGLQLGWNGMLSPNWLLGTEADLSAGNLRDNALDSGGVSVTGKVDLFGNVRARLGYLLDNRSLLYVTGGMAWSHNRVDLVDGLDSEHITGYNVGWAYGGGWEYMLDPRWSFKVEYLYYDLGKWHEHTSIQGQESKGDLSFSTVKVGVNYRFGEGAGAPAAMPVKAARAPASIWNGSYVGIHAGYVRSDLDAADTVATPARNVSLNPSGGQVGFQTGYNWLFAPNSLLGFEADNTFLRNKDDGVTSNPAVSAHAKIDNLGTVRLRLGYLDGNSLLYATGGLAYGRVRYGEQGAAIDAFSTKYYNLGWTVGAGWEYSFAPRWSAKIEYLYADLGDTSDTIAGVGTMKTDLKVQTVKAGLNYRFQWSDLLGGR
jgi:outer membrane immunogenic protein